MSLRAATASVRTAIEIRFIYKSRSASAKRDNHPRICVGCCCGIAVHQSQQQFSRAFGCSRSRRVAGESRQRFLLSCDQLWFQYPFCQQTRDTSDVRFRISMGNELGHHFLIGDQIRQGDESTVHQEPRHETTDGGDSVQHDSWGFPRQELQAD